MHTGTCADDPRQRQIHAHVMQVTAYPMTTLHAADRHRDRLQHALQQHCAAWDNTSTFHTLHRIFFVTYHVVNWRCAQEESIVNSNLDDTFLDLPQSQWYL